jgi:hypothetical protein
MIKPEPRSYRPDTYMLQPYVVATGFVKQSRRRAIMHSETLYREPRVGRDVARGGLPRAAPCLAGFDTADSFPCASACQYLSATLMSGSGAGP